MGNIYSFCSVFSLANTLSSLRVSLFIIIIFLVSGGLLFSQKTIGVQKTEIPPVINGRVDDDCWKSASSISEFFQREPAEGEPMTEKTEVFITFDANNIYFGIKCYQDPETISAKEMIRDGDTGSDDRVHIVLDTYLDHRNAFYFRVNALGGIQDALHSQNGNVINNNWNGLWTGKAKITGEGWEAEVAIPFKSIGFNKNSDQWGLRINRYISKKREFGSWPNGNLNSNKFQLTDAGIIEGLKGITQGIGLDIAPYLISGFDSKKDISTKYKINGGVDAYYQVTPSLKASLSINTDFAETEADSRQINLTRFSLRLHEKRNFFLDGSNYFYFGIEGKGIEPPSGKMSPFFSRTIGLNSEGLPIPVNYGAKLTGHINNWNIGMLHVSDDRDYGNTHFTVARVNRNIGQQSSIGMISTFGNSYDSTSNMVGGLDIKLASSKFRGNKNISLVLFGLKSVSDKIHGKDFSWGGTFSYPNDLINFRLGHVQIGENFVAGLGYVPRTNIKETFGSLTIGPRLNKWGIRQVLFGGEFDYIIDFSNKLQTREMSVSPIGIRFESGEMLSYNIINKYDFLDKDFNIYSDYVIPAAEYSWWENQYTFTSEASRKVYGKILYGSGNFYTGRQNFLELTANWKVFVHLFIGGTYTTNMVKLPEGDFTADIFQFNANILFSPDLTLYNYLQYDSESEVVGLQSRFQWILKPGNEILLVWNSGYTKPLERYQLNESAMRLKLKYNIRF